jgi:hypothetical protein
MVVNIKSLEYYKNNFCISGLSDIHLYLLYLSYFYSTKIFSKERLFARMQKLKFYGKEYFEPKNHSSKFKTSSDKKSILEVFGELAPYNAKLDVLALLHIIKIFYNVPRKIAIKIFNEHFKTCIKYNWNESNNLTNIYYKLDCLEKLELSRTEYDFRTCEMECFSTDAHKDIAQEIRKLLPPLPNFQNELDTLFNLYNVSFTTLYKISYNKPLETPKQ